MNSSFQLLLYEQDYIYILFTGLRASIGHLVRGSWFEEMHYIENLN